VAKKFKITISVKNGIILEKSQDMWFDCTQVTPVGVQVARSYNSSECIVARKAYMFYQGGMQFGTFLFTTLQEFNDYVNTQCKEQVCCFITFNGCYITFNGKRISFNNGV
jgi:hypothetical protein